MNRIKALRLEKGLKQSDLANIMKVSQNTISYWEIGRYEPDLDAIKTLSEYFNVSTDYLLHNTDDPTPPNSKESINDEENSDEELLQGLRFAYYGGKNKKFTKEDREELIELAKFMKKFKKDKANQNDRIGEN